MKTREFEKRYGVRLRRIQGQLKGIEKWYQEKHVAKMC